MIDRNKRVKLRFRNRVFLSAAVLKTWTHEILMRSQTNGIASKQSTKKKTQKSILKKISTDESWSMLGTVFEKLLENKFWFFFSFLMQHCVMVYLLWSLLVRCFSVAIRFPMCKCNHRHTHTHTLFEDCILVTFVFHI